MKYTKQPGKEPLVEFYTRELSILRDAKDILADYRRLTTNESDFNSANDKVKAIMEAIDEILAAQKKDLTEVLEFELTAESAENSPEN